MAYDNINHKFIQSTEKPLIGMNTEVALLITNQYSKQNLSAEKWRKKKEKWTVSYEFPPGEIKKSKPINYLVIADYIRSNPYFDPAAFDLPELSCPWLDHASEIKMDYHMFDNTAIFGITSGDLQAHYYGNKYPIHPLLQREGRLYTSFQPQLIRRITRERTRLIEMSDKSLSDDWIFDLRNLISDSISLLDIALNQLYIKAEYDPMPGWKFDKGVLGERHGRRLNDKFKWIYQITGNILNAESEKENLEILKDLRNHFMHFDPPSIVITLEEATNWLNQIIDIGRLIVKIRRAIKVDISVALINFLLQKEAIFVPYVKGKRAPLNPNKKEDYYSSIWGK